MKNKNPKVFLDLNVILKLLDGYEIPELVGSIDVFISSSSYNIVTYLWDIKRIGCSKTELDDFFNSVTIIETDQVACSEYFSNLKLTNPNDIDDGLQIACAMLVDADLFLTYDEKVYEKYNSVYNIILCK